MNRAVIFDMDGVLVDSYQAHFESWKALAAEHGRSFSEEDFARTFGRTSRDIIESLWGASRIAAADVERMDQRKEALYRERVARDFPEMDGASDLIDALREAGFALAVGSSGPPENVDLVLARLGPRHLFDAVVTGRDVSRGKPDPQVFLLAAERLGVVPLRCLVVEDAPAGIEAATRAGMASVALLSTGRRAEDFTGVSPARLVRSLRELTPDVCARIIDRRRSGSAAPGSDLRAGGRPGGGEKARRP
jgi:beta-phosphoglucomutase family hydrolase